MIQLVKETKPVNVLSVDEWRDNEEVVVGIVLDKAYILNKEGDKFIFRNIVNHQYGANGFHDSRKTLINSFLHLMDDAEVFVFDGVYSAMKFLEKKMGAKLDKQSKKE